jgi:hypothetical protein
MNTLNQWCYLSRAALQGKQSLAQGGYISDEEGRIVGPEGRLSLKAFVGVVLASEETGPISAASLQRVREYALYLMSHCQTRWTVGFFTLAAVGGLVAAVLKSQSLLEQQWVWVGMAAGAATSVVALTGFSVRLHRHSQRLIAQLDERLARVERPEAPRPSPKGDLATELKQLQGRELTFTEEFFSAGRNQTIPTAETVALDPLSVWAWKFKLVPPRYWDTGCPHADNILFHIVRYLQSRRLESDFRDTATSILGMMIPTYGHCIDSKTPILESIYYSYVAPGTYNPQADSIQQMVSRYLMTRRRGHLEGVVMDQVRHSSESTGVVTYFLNRFSGSFYLGQATRAHYGSFGYWSHEAQIAAAFRSSYPGVAVTHLQELMDGWAPVADNNLVGRIREWFNATYIEESMGALLDEETATLHQRDPMRLMLWKIGLLTDRIADAAAL